MSKNIDEQLLMDLASQVGLDDGGSYRQQQQRGGQPSAWQGAPGRQSSPDLQAMARAEAAAEAMKGKSEDEVLAEIMRLKSTLQRDRGAYEKQIRAVKSLRGMMNPQQRQRLDRVLKLLED